MAGFVNKEFNLSSSSRTSDYLRKKLSKVKFSNDLTTNIVNMQDVDKILSISSMTKTGFNFDNQQPADFNTLRDTCRSYAKEDDIDEILDIICDESICSTVQDESFAYIKSSITDLTSERSEKLTEYFEKFRLYFGLMNTDAVWKLFRKFIIDGKIAYQIVYSKNGKTIEGFIELDAAKVQVTFDRETHEKRYSVETYDINTLRPIHQDLCEQEIIFITYSDEDDNVSYVSRLIRSFNILRIMESTRITFAVTNASFKMMYTVPVGSTSYQKGRQRLAQVAADHAEQVDFNWTNGQIKTNGKPMLPFYKQIFFAQQDGQKPEIQVLNNSGGPDLSNMDAIKYFAEKFQQITKIPLARFNRLSQPQQSYNTEGVFRDEIRFSKFIARLRNIFQILFIKPIYIQMCLDDDIKDDLKFFSSLSLIYQSDSTYLQEKMIDLLRKNAEAISSVMQSLQVTDAEGNQTSYLDMEFMIRKFSTLSDNDLKLNEEMKKKAKEKAAAAAKEAEAAAQQEQGGGEQGMEGGESGGEPAMPEPPQEEPPQEEPQLEA